MKQTGVRSSIARSVAFLESSGVPNLRLYALGVPLALLASVSVHATQPSIAIFAAYFAANVVSFSFTGLVFWPLYLISKRMVLARGGSIALWFLLLLGAALGFAKQLSTTFLVVWFGLEFGFFEALETRLVTPLLGLWVVMSTAAFQAARNRFEALRRQLVSERARRAAAQAGGGLAAKTDALADSPHLTKLVSEVRGQLSADSLNSGELTGRQLAQLLRQIVNNQVRPLSHEIWQRESAKVPGYRISDLAARAIVQERYPVITIVLIYGLTSLPTIFGAAPEGTGPAWLITLVAGITVGLYLANAAKRLRPNRGFAPLSLAITISAVVTSSSLLATLLFGQLVNLNQLLLLIVSTWWLATITAVAGVVVVARKNYAGQLASLEGLLSDEIDREAAHAKSQLRDREIANYLHSSVQNQLLAQALRIESETDVDLARELKQIIALLEPRADASAASIAKQLAQLAADWQGLINIEFAIDPAAELDPATQQLVGLIAVEAVNNAYRHGGADHIVISLAPGTLTVRDNGSLAPAGRAGEPGLGSKLFDSAGQWSLKPVENGSELRVNFA